MLVVGVGGSLGTSLSRLLMHFGNHLEVVFVVEKWHCYIID